MPPKPNTLIAVVGPTASGKTALAIALAKELGGEIVSADSMQIYRGMDIATAKPTPEEMAEVPHHLIGFWPPEKPFSVAQYAILAREKIDDILRRGRVPVLCGGTGLYIKAIVDHIQYEEETGEDAALRERLRRQAQDEGNLAVWRQLQAMDPQTAERIHPNNLGRVIRAIEVMQVSGRSIREQEERSRQAPCPYHVLQIGLRYRNRENLYERIGRRVDAMAEAGLPEEARAVRQQGLTATAAQAIGYKELYDWMDGTLPLEEALENLKRSTRRYAKRQLTWFGADARIRWIEPDALQAGETVTEQAMRIIENDGEETA
ncbi:MAG: tRNA (adenosine(37)-N6)-dimethylallyltransferase MiaA [Angelakisella sp.]|nr:tRNA (adenosine(37)-N6)-dimethylallyltransferase MiaA [Angelakisella sp.]